MKLLSGWAPSPAVAPRRPRTGQIPRPVQDLHHGSLSEWNAPVSPVGPEGNFPYSLRGGAWGSRSTPGPSSPSPGPPVTGPPRGLVTAGPSRPANSGLDPPHPGNPPAGGRARAPHDCQAAAPRTSPRDGADTRPIRAQSAASPWRRRRAQERKGVRTRRAAASGLPKAPPPCCRGWPRRCLSGKRRSPPA